MLDSLGCDLRPDPEGRLSFPLFFCLTNTQMGKHKKAGRSLLESFMYSNGDAGDNGKLY